MKPTCLAGSAGHNIVTLMKLGNVDADADAVAKEEYEGGRRISG